MQQENASTPPELAAVIAQLGKAGQRLTEMLASEGASGNLSVFLRLAAPPPATFTQNEIIELPLPVPELAGGSLIVTGSGTRSREILETPEACLGYVELHAGGLTGTLHSAPQRQFARLTSELNSHLAVHRDQVHRANLQFHAIVHAQPRRITYLSHVAIYQDEETLNRRLLRWQPEAILNFPNGIGLVPFHLPGQAELMLANERALHDRNVVVWSKHGVMARSSASVAAAVDLIEYLETAADYETMDRLMGGMGQGLSPEQLRSVAEAYGVKQRLF